jgi:hypothetical protein
VLYVPADQPRKAEHIKQAIETDLELDTCDTTLERYKILLQESISVSVKTGGQLNILRLLTIT